MDLDGSDDDDLDWAGLRRPLPDSSARRPHGRRALAWDGLLGSRAAPASQLPRRPGIAQPADAGPVRVSLRYQAAHLPQLGRAGPL